MVCHHSFHNVYGFQRHWFNEMQLLIHKPLQLIDCFHDRCFAGFEAVAVAWFYKKSCLGSFFTTSLAENL